ncbi:MAG: hypothetical protein M2R45_01191 [Verrucomicrobia subdivision 3 bacterium]|nr:hypothetical protein [Limisphaerales bacterium]MCS1415256.1 hypothetical protein [Limisphaerales bacterium]
MPSVTTVLYSLLLLTASMPVMQSHHSNKIIVTPIAVW